MTKNPFINQIKRITALITNRDGDSSKTQHSVSAQVDDAPGWASIGAQNHERTAFDVNVLYGDTLNAWRTNPMAWRIISITTDYVLGDNLKISSPYPAVDDFIRRFWNHPKNRMDLRLAPMCDELSRAGDLFVLLFRNPSDGMSYIRFTTKDRISKIQTARRDWESELSYQEKTPDSFEGKKWYSPAHSAIRKHKAVMLHYAINRPVGALLGESDLSTLLPWLRRYTRMLEDRVRLHWAARMFLWAVTVPTGRVRSKQEQYRRPPEAGSIIVKDEAERWEPVAPTLHGGDAGHDMKAVRGMIDAGSGFPPHWRGEAQSANLATATAMQAPTERHLQRRQNYFGFILQDILYNAYLRAEQRGTLPPLPSHDYADLFTVDAADISRTDNRDLAHAANELSQAIERITSLLPNRSPKLEKLMLRMLFKFAGEPLSSQQIENIYSEMNERRSHDQTTP